MEAELTIKKEGIYTMTSSHTRAKRSGARLVATIEGTCTTCEEWFDKGDYIRYESNNPVHTECYGVNNEHS